MAQAHYTGETLVYVTLLSADVLKTALCDFTVCRCTEDTFLYDTFLMAQLIYTGETLVFVTSLSADVLKTPF